MLLHNCNFAIVMNHNVNYDLHLCFMMVLGDPYGIGHDPHVENHYLRLSDMLSQGTGILFLHV